VRQSVTFPGEAQVGSIHLPSGQLTTLKLVSAHRAYPPLDGLCGFCGLQSIFYIRGLVVCPDRAIWLSAVPSVSVKPRCQPMLSMSAPGPFVATACWAFHRNYPGGHVPFGRVSFLKVRRRDTFGLCGNVPHLVVLGERYKRQPEDACRGYFRLR
jgi:hypothetical protein